MEKTTTSNSFVYRIHTPDGFYFTTSDEIARIAYVMGATINCGRITI